MLGPSKPNYLPLFHFECVHFGEAAKEYAKHVSVLLDGLAESAGEEYYGLYTRVIPPLHWAATSIYVIAMIEQKFNEACDIAQSFKGLPSRFSDEKFSKNKGIYRARDYLINYAKITLEISTVEWGHATKLTELRNALAHGGSREKLKKLEAYQRKTDAFILGRDDIYATSETVDHVIRHGSIILENLGRSIYKLS